MDCLKDLIKFRNHCDVDYKGKYVNDFIEVDNTILANLANENELTGKQYGQNLIDAATEKVLADLYTSTGNAVFSHSIEKLNYDGRFVGSTPIANSGVIIRDVTNSELTVIQLESVRIKPLFDGDFTIVVDNGIESTEFDFVAVNGVEMDYKLDYKTNKKTVKIFAKDTTLKFAQSILSKTTCSSCNGKKFNLSAQSLFNMQPKADPPSIIPIAYLSCDAENLICVILKNKTIKQIFLKALSLAIGVSLFDRLSLSNRLNDTTLNINSDAVSAYRNKLEVDYQETMFGVNYASGVNRSNIMPLTNIVKSNLKVSSDICVNCNSIISSSTAIF